MTNEPLTIDLSEDWSLYDLNYTGMRGGELFESTVSEGAIILPL